MSECGKNISEYECFEQLIQSEKNEKKMGVMRNQSNSDCVTLSYSKRDEAIKCSICDLSFDSFENFQSHSLTTEHALKVMLKQANSNLVPSTSSAMNNHEVNATKYDVESTNEESILPELNSKVSNLWYESCKVCSKIFSGPEPYKQHVESVAHKKKIGLSQNLTIIGGNLEVLKCEPCDKSFSGQVPYAQHLSSEVHRRKLQNIQATKKYLTGIDSVNTQGESEIERKKDEIKLWFCDTCNIQCTGLAPYEQHIQGSTHYKNARRFQSQKNFLKTYNDMQASFGKDKILEEPKNILQLVNGNYQNGDSETPNDSVKMDIDTMTQSRIQVINFNENGKCSENLENKPNLMNGSYQKDNGDKQNDSVLPELMDKIKVVSSNELTKLIKVIPPDDKINFDELDKVKNLAAQQNKSENIEKIPESIENDFNDDLKKKTEKETKSKVYQICNVCNVQLFDKDSAADHYESKEHFEKRWGKKICSSNS